MNALVSVITVNYFCHELTARAVGSVKTDDPSAQAIVVDNSADSIESEALRNALPGGTELIVASANLGFGRACNLALEQATGEWILLLNPDALVLPGCLGRLVETLQSHPNAGAVSPVAQWDEAGSFLLPPGQMQTPAWEWLLTLGTSFPRFGCWLSERFSAWSLGCLNAAKPVAQAMLSGGHMLLRRRAIDAIGGLFDPDFFLYYEDTDLCRRLKAAGFGLLLDPKARVVHEWRSDPAKGRHGPDSRRHYLAKHFPRSWLTDSRRSWMERRWPAKAISGIHELGLCVKSPTFELPTQQTGPWLLELSPHPLLIPAIVSFSLTPPCRIPPHLWRFLGTGRYWVRITGPDGQKLLYSWESANQTVT